MMRLQPLLCCLSDSFAFFTYCYTSRAQVIGEIAQIEAQVVAAQEASTAALSKEEHARTRVHEVETIIANFQSQVCVWVLVSLMCCALDNQTRTL